MAEKRVLIEGMYPPGSTLPISGSITSTPSGTQNVLITNPVNNPAFITNVPNPTTTNTYVFSQDEVAGVAAANNYLTVFNPLGSGKTMIFGAVFISSTTAGGSTVTAPMRGFRITAASAGTLQAASATAKFVSTMPDPVAEVRTGTVTATLGAAMFNVPPPLSAANGMAMPYGVLNPYPAQSFLFAPGEGICLRESTGDVDLRWNLSFVWAEV